MRRTLYHLGCLAASAAVLALVVSCANGQVAAGLAMAFVLLLAGVALSVPFALVSPNLPVVSMRRRSRLIGVIGLAIPLAVWLGDKLLAACWMGVFRLRTATVAR